MELLLKETTQMNTELFNYLLSIPESQIYSQDHEPLLQHPADILLKQTKNFYSSITKLLSVCETDQDCSNEIQNAFITLDSFYDNCFNIIKTLYPKTESIKIFTSDWLVDSNIFDGKYFFQYTNMHHSFVSTVSNIIKHDTSSIIPIQFRDVKTDNPIFGFYFATLIDNDKIGPDERIHKPYQNIRTAFSYNFIIRKLIGLMFFYEFNLYKIIKKPISIKKSYTNNVYLDLYNIGLSLETNFYINEYSLPTSDFKSIGKSKVVKFPTMFKSIEPLTYNYQLTTSIETNPRTQSAKGYLPYVGKISK